MTALKKLEVLIKTYLNNKDGIHKFPHEFPNELRLRILGNEQVSGISKLHKFIAQCPVFLPK